MQGNTQIAIFVPKLPDATSLEWEPFAPGGEPAGWSARAFGSEELPSGRIDRTSFWRHEGGELTYSTTQTEFVVILEGRVELLVEGELVAQLCAGQIALIPAGFKGVWATQEPVTKFSAVFGTAASRAS